MFASVRRTGQYALVVAGAVEPDEGLQRRLAGCSSRWGLRVAERLSGGYSADVFACRDEDGTDLVLKLTTTAQQASTQAIALRAWAGHGAVRLIDSAEEYAALLLVRLFPGTPLPAGNDAFAIAVMTEVLGALHGVAIPAESLPSMLVSFDEYLEDAVTNSDEGAAGLALLDASRDAAMRLCESTRCSVLLHGDLLDKNVLLSEAGYVATDPIPRIGDPASDVGFFAAGRQPYDHIIERARRLSNAVGVDAERSIRWAAIWAVGEACETWRADSDQLQAWITSGDLAELLAV